MDNPFRAVKSQWMTAIRKGLEAKKEFQEDADEAMRFFRGPYDFMYGLKAANQRGDFVFTGDSGVPRPQVCMTLNKVAEAVQIFGPTLYHKNPNRLVTPRELPLLPIEAVGNPQDPQAQAMYLAMAQMVQQGRSVDQARAALLQYYQNYTPTALDLKSHMRRKVDEGIIKGMGLTIAEVYQPAGARWKMVGSFQRTVDDLVLDPDVTLRDDCKWGALRCCHPVWEVEAKYGLPPGTIKGNSESGTQAASVDGSGGLGDYARKRGETNDLVVYWKLYSKMGMGSLLKGLNKTTTGQLQDEARNLDHFGQYVHLVLCENHEWPLNIQPTIWDDPQLIGQAVQWETPFWADDAWPWSALVFHEVPNQVWPMSHFKPAMGELKFLNWAYSFIASKIQKTCRDYLAVKKSVGEEIKRVLQSGMDLELIEIEAAHGTISDVVQFLQYPQFNNDIWKVIAAIEVNFEKRVGLLPLMYGYQETQDRSATTTQVKTAQMNVRPEDMANKVEDDAGDMARHEALAARWNLEPQDVAPVMGPMGAQWWQQYVAPASPDELIHQLEYRIEAGSIRKPNKEAQVATATAAMQNLFQPLLQVAMQTGQMDPVNAVIELFVKSQDADPTRFFIKPPPPPPENTGPTEADERAQEMQHSEAEFQMTMRHDAEKHKLDLKQQKEKAASDKSIARSKASKNGAAA